MYVAMTDIRTDIVVTRAAYKRPHDNLTYSIKEAYSTYSHMKTKQVLAQYNQRDTPLKVQAPSPSPYQKAES